MDANDAVQARIQAIRQGGAPKYHARLKEQGKLPARERLQLLLDPGSEVEDGLFARNQDTDLPADGVVTVVGRMNGRPVCAMANDATVKAGSWGRHTVEKIIRLQETALRMRVPILYLVDSAGARLDEQAQMFPGRRHAGLIFYNQVHMSGVVPQVCILFGPSPAGAAYFPAFCDLVVMVDGHASAFLGSPRMSEMVTGEKVTPEEMGGARMHCSVSGLGDLLVADEAEAVEAARRFLSYLPQHWEEPPAAAPPAPPAAGRPIAEIVPANQTQVFDMKEVVGRLVDEGSFFELKPLFGPELITGLARLDGRMIGVVANQPRVKAGVLFPDSAEKMAHFVWLCNAYGIPLLFLADVSGFMIGSRVERQGIIRRGAKALVAVAQATVPKISVVVRKASGAGYMAMSGAPFQPDCCLALPTAQITIMAAEAAVNAIYYNKIMELPPEERAAFVAARRQEYNAQVDIYKLASELHVDAIVPPDNLRDELIRRFGLYSGKQAVFPARRNVVLRG